MACSTLYDNSLSYLYPLSHLPGKDKKIQNVIPLCMDCFLLSYYHLG